MSTVATIVRTAPLPESVQMALLPTYGEDLAENPYLCEPAWFALWGPKRPSRAWMASSLVTRVLSPQQRAKVLSTETRKSVLQSLLVSDELRDEDLLAVLSKPLPAKEIESALNVLTLPAELEESLARKVSAPAFATWVCARGDASDDLVDDALTALAQATGGRPRARWRAYQGLVVCYDRAVAAAVGSAQAELVVSAAGSPRLRDEALQGELLDHITTLDPEVGNMAILALAGNPVVAQQVLDRIVASAEVQGPHQRSFQSAAGNIRRRAARGRHPITVDLRELDDPDLLDWVVQQRMPYQPYQDSWDESRPAKAWHLWYLLGNPNLSPDTVKSIWSEIHGVLPARLWGPHLPELLDRARPAMAPGQEYLPGMARCASFAWPRYPRSETRFAPYNPRRAAKVLCNRPYGSSTEDIVEYLIEHLGDSAAHWETALALFDGFDGTLHELIEVVGALD